MTTFLEPLGHGITVIDTGYVRPRFDASYLIVESGRAAFVDTGTNHAVPRMLAALDAQGLGPDAVDYVIVTHVHLDHAGGAGKLMAALPNARLVAHPRAARHMIDPAALIEGVTAVYGAEVVARDYGRIEPVAAERVISTADGMVIELGGRPLAFADTPGHARHHHCIWDEASRGWFTGDTFGISYPELAQGQHRYIFPTTTPVQFEPDALRVSIDRLCARAPRAMYLTHYGEVTGIDALAVQLREQLDAMVAVARANAASASRHDAIKRALGEIYAGAAAKAGLGIGAPALLASLDLDIELNAQGLGVWLDK